MSIVAQPAVPCYFKQIRSFAWIGNQNPSKDVAGVWSDILGKGEWSRHDVLVEEVDVVTLGIVWVIVKRKISSKHSVLFRDISIQSL